MIDEQKFFAWLDGEVTGPEAEEIEREVAADPQRLRLAEEHRALGRRLKAALDPIAAAPVPERLDMAVRGQPAEVVDLAAAKRQRDTRRTWNPIPQWAALAATLAVGILVGTMAPQQGTAPVAVEGGKLYAAAALNQALDRQLASAPAGTVRIGVTFRDQTGAICRSFTQPQSSGLACRDPRGWQVRGLFAAPEGQTGDYRMAAGMDPNLASLIGSAMAGDPFGAAEEKAAQARGWR